MESKINMQEEKQEVGHVIRVVEEEEEDDGPPPGFQCIITPQPQPPQAEKTEVDDDDDEGPPPGFHSIAPKPSPLLPSSDMGSSKQEDIEDEEIGPPPGWEFVSLANALPKPSSNTADAKMESSGKLNEGEGEGEGEDEDEDEGEDEDEDEEEEEDEDEEEEEEDEDEDEDEEEDEGPPPGWETVLSHQMAAPSTPLLQPSSTVFSDMEKGKQEITRNDDEEMTTNDDEVPQSVSQFTSMAGQSSPPTPKLQQLPSSASPEAGNKGDTNDEDKKPTSERQSASPKPPLQPAPHPSTPVAAPSSSEKAQLVCGTCRKLLLYPRGAKLVQCPGCEEVNFVLEAHEVGQVKCGDCGLLLMYPHGAPAVQCTSCRFVNEIGAHNRRPPLSVQQAQRRRRSNRGRARR